MDTFPVGEGVAVKDGIDKEDGGRNVIEDSVAPELDVEEMGIEDADSEGTVDKELEDEAGEVMTALDSAVWLVDKGVDTLELEVVVELAAEVPGLETDVPLLTTA